MQRIGIITMMSNNFGNRLQNYALQKCIENMDLQVETIYNSVKEIPKSEMTISNIAKKSVNKIKNVIMKIKYKDINKKRNELFNKFNNEYIKFAMEKIMDKNYDLNNLNAKFDKFIVGSDQVWNPYAYRNKEIDFLSFSPKEKNSTYAVSFGVETLDKKFEDIYKKGLENFKYISVREDKGAEIVKKLSNKEVDVLIDPTMLLTKEEWMKVEKKPEQLKTKKYILNYFLGKLSKENQKNIEKIAKENNCEIINIMDKNEDFYISGPSEFLYLERNAFLVCTDSFHSCVFAILFGTPFIVFDRKDNLVNMNSRIDTLLTKFELKDRKFEKEITQNNINCDYVKTYNILKTEREKSINFLKEALK